MALRSGGQSPGSPRRSGRSVHSPSGRSLPVHGRGVRGPWGRSAHTGGARHLRLCGASVRRQSARAEAGRSACAPPPAAGRTCSGRRSPRWRPARPGSADNATPSRFGPRNRRLAVRPPAPGAVRAAGSGGWPPGYAAGVPVRGSDNRPGAWQLCADRAYVPASPLAGQWLDHSKPHTTGRKRFLSRPPAIPGLLPPLPLVERSDHRSRQPAGQVDKPPRAHPALPGRCSSGTSWPSRPGSSPGAKGEHHLPPESSRRELARAARLHQCRPVLAHCAAPPSCGRCRAGAGGRDRRGQSRPVPNRSPAPAPAAHRPFCRRSRTPPNRRAGDGR